MRLYYDSGVLVKLYVREWLSDAVINFAEEQESPISFNPLQELEVRNALRLKRFRKEIKTDEHDRATKLITENLNDELLVRGFIEWPRALLEAETISRKMTGKVGSRTIDIIHLGIAEVGDVEGFVSLDDRQIRAAEATKLTIIDLREGLDVHF
jgi:predicted nucleic acid-binding protein